MLATNVAETSLTVPGIRYVIDSGLARVKRYSYRSKVEQLQVEGISQAAANQRAGRCGRVAHGICIRLYDETDFASRPRFTDPEILRSSLAGVILRMKALNLGSVEDFPFLEAPPKKAIADGYDLLGELNAVDDSNELTAIGKALSKLPLDPRVGRMILEARDREALTEVLIIASALSVQDVRDRPLEHQQAADQQHKKFDDEKSEFMGCWSAACWCSSGRSRTSCTDKRRGDDQHLAQRRAVARLGSHAPHARVQRQPTAPGRRSASARCRRRPRSARRAAHSRRRWPCPAAPPGTGRPRQLQAQRLHAQDHAGRDERRISGSVKRGREAKSVSS